MYALYIVETVPFRVDEIIISEGSLLDRRYSKKIFAEPLENLRRFFLFFSFLKTFGESPKNLWRTFRGQLLYRLSVYKNVCTKIENDRDEMALEMRPSEVITTSDKSNPNETELSILDERFKNRFSRSVTHATTLTRMSTEISEKSQLFV